MDVDPHGGTIIPTARKRLIGQDGVINGAVLSTVANEIIPPSGFVNEKVNLLENTPSEIVDKS